METTEQQITRQDFDEEARRFYEAYYPHADTSKGYFCYDEKTKKGTYQHKDAAISVRGDVCFNLKWKNGNKLSFLSSVIKNEKDNASLFQQLDVLQYSPMNLSIMPKTGGLNNLKQAIGSDRFDTFAWLLDLYYKGIDAPVLNGGAQNMCIENRIALKSFLDSYQDAADYFQDVYGLDGAFVNELIAGGDQAITDTEGFYRYLDLAVRFWKKRMHQKKIRTYLEPADEERYGNALEALSNITKNKRFHAIAERKQEPGSRIILITGASHTGKTLLAQCLLERFHWPYLSIDHLKMGLIRSGQTALTPVDDKALTGYLWPIVREMIRTAIENRQNLILEGCYVPFDWRRDFDEKYLPSIRFLCLAMSEAYIDAHFAEIKAHASDIEERLDDSGLSPEGLKQENQDYIEGFRSRGERVLQIEDDYARSIQSLFDTNDFM